MFPTFQSLENCILAVQKDGFALEFVKEEYKTPEVCLAAVKKNGSALKFVNE